MRAYCNRMMEINNYLVRFPPAFNITQKKTEGELVDILHAGTPRKWQADMIHFGFDSITATSQNLLEFCERMEFMEEMTGEQKTFNEVNPKTGRTGGMGRSYAPPKHSERVAYNNKRRTAFKNQRARYGSEQQPERGYDKKQRARYGSDQQPGRGYQN